MFSTPESLSRRTGKSSVDRPTYLKQLVEEYDCPTTDEDKREQVLANLANFAYDPINYEYFRRFNVMDIFIKNLKEFYNNRAEFTASLNERKLNFSLSGICNLCLDVRNKEYLLKSDLISMIYFCLTRISKDNEEILLVLITTLVFLFDENTKTEILLNRNGNLLIKSLCDSASKRISNIAKVFIDDYINGNTSN